MSYARGHRGATAGGFGGGSTGGMTPGKRTLVESRYDGRRAAGAEAVAGQAEPEQKRSEEEPRTRATQVTAVFRKGSSTPETSEGTYTRNPDAMVAEQR